MNANRLASIARSLPVVLAAIFAGTILILINPGLFWDDWVWVFQEPAENIRIGRELGVWWAGYFNNFIYSMPDPTGTLRIIALAGWVIAGGAAAFVLHRTGHLSRRDAFAFFLLYCASHASPLRFTNSVAFYNVYLASFWTGCAILIVNPANRRRQLASLPFFFFSFYLNSIFVLYGLLLFYLAVLMRRKYGRSEVMPEGNPLYIALSKDLRKEALRNAASAAKRFALRFTRVYPALVLLPLAALLLIRILRVKSELYSGYNKVQGNLFFSGVIKSFRIIFANIRDYFHAPYTDAPVLLAALAAAGFILFLLLLSLARTSWQPVSWRKAFSQFGVAMLLFAAGVFPYLAVGKTPDLDDFYESRHILSAMPGLVMALIALLNMMDLALSRVRVPASSGKNLLLALLLGISVTFGVLAGINMWRDVFLQRATAAFIKSNRDKLEGYKTFIFVDETTNMRVGQRTILNYEYTGNLITIFGGRDRIGVSAEEYLQWPRGIALLKEAAMRRRYNLKDYRFDRQHAIIRIRNSDTDFSSWDVLRTVKAYMLGEPYEDAIAAKYFRFELYFEFIDADSKVKEMRRIYDALYEYKKKHGTFPTSVPPKRINSQSVPYYSILTRPSKEWPPLAPPASINNIPGLIPEYAPPLSTNDGMGTEQPAYIYMSDGEDFKIVYSNAPDMPYVKQAYPDLMDPVRPTAYGLWTENARGW